MFIQLKYKKLYHQLDALSDPRSPPNSKEDETKIANEHLSGFERVWYRANVLNDRIVSIILYGTLREDLGTALLNSLKLNNMLLLIVFFLVPIF